MTQKQIKITVSEKMNALIEERARRLGSKPATYCYNIIFENLRKELEKNA